MKFFIAALLGSAAFADAVNVEERTDAEQAWYDSFATDAGSDLITLACLCYDDLSSWDLRPMSFPENSGYYTVTDGALADGNYQEVVFNPCHYLNFSAVFPNDPSLSALIGDI